MSLQRALYSLLLRVALPFQVLRLLVRGRMGPDCRQALRAHLALGLPPRDDRPLWLHAASVGEVQALAPLVRHLRQRWPDLPLLVTVGTATGLARARQLLSGSASTAGDPLLRLQPAAWDLPGAARRFIATQRPRLAVFVETELWPNLLQAAARDGIALLLASARVSARSTRRYRRWAAGLMRETVRHFTLIGAQTVADRERFIELGANAAAVQCWGNLKFDFTPPAGLAAQAAALRARLAARAPLWVAGSTHDGEEQICLAAQTRLQQAALAANRPAPVLVLAPRRPERFDEVARQISGAGFTLGRHSRAQQEPAQVWLVDCLGELLPYYAAADAVFVGASLVPAGGHNLLEPAALGRPVLSGPFTDNAPDVARQLQQAGAMRRVQDARTLADAVGSVLEDAALARRMGEAAAAVVAAHGGATTRTLAAISAGLGCQPERSAAG